MSTGRKDSLTENFVFSMYSDIIQYIGDGCEKLFFNGENPEARAQDTNFSCRSELDTSLELHADNYNSNYNEEELDTLLVEDAADIFINETDEIKNKVKTVEIKFASGNRFYGEIKNRMLHGQGEYRWKNGVLYKGKFRENNISGRGLLEWNNSCWYEGEFLNGYRHGKGMIVDQENRFMYTGDWYTGRKHGKGYACCKENSYDGDWAMDKMEGIGSRNYSSGVRYIGQWENNLRHGIGMMVWKNGDIYYGHWEYGEMNGYGEYIWNNDSISQTNRISYVGNWKNGKRDGEGSLKLGLIRKPKSSTSLEYKQKDC